MMRPVSMDPYRERIAAFDGLASRVRLFRGRPVPTDSARVVNGVGLASFTMRVERVLNELSGLSDLKPPANIWGRFCGGARGGGFAGVGAQSRTRLRARTRPPSRIPIRCSH